MAASMHDQRAREALARIDRALSRLEKASAGPSGDERAELDRLRAAHQLLRNRVESAIGEIDAMLAAPEQDEG